MSYLCDVTLPALLITCQFLFCGTKKINRIFYEWKNIIYLSFLWSIFIIPVMFLYLPSTEDSIIFIISVFSLLLFWIVDVSYVFTTFLLIVTAFVFSTEVMHNNYVPQPWGAHVAFSVDPGGGGSVATCLQSISLLNGQILAKLTQIYHWEGEKCWLDFGDLDPIFKVTGGLRLLENGA